MSEDRLGAMKAWHARTAADWEAFQAAEVQLAEAYESGDETALLVACDEVESAVRGAERWALEDPCPDAILGDHYSGILTAYNELTLNLRHALTGPEDEREDAVDWVVDRGTASIENHASGINSRMEELLR